MRVNEESSSDDEAIGDFTSDGHTYVLSSESLTHDSRVILLLPSPAERDSLLHFETSDSEGTASYCAENDEDIVSNSGTINNSDNVAEDEEEDNDSEVENNDNNANDNADDM